jgi:hypothetical protein
MAIFAPYRLLSEMAAPRVLSERLESRLDSYRQHGLFTDVVLASGDERCPCQRVLLASYCRWFERAFLENPTPDGPLILAIPVNPNGILSQFVALLYTGECEISLQTLPPLLKMALFYESDVLSAVFRYFVQQATQDHTLLQLAREFYRLDLADDAVNLAPQLAPHFARLLNPTKEQRIFTFEELCESVSPKLFAAILKEPVLKSEARECLCPARLVALIDSYVGDRVFEDLEDLEALASVVSWTEPDSFVHLVKQRCDWLPPKFARPLLSQILTRRKRTLVSFEREAQRAAGSVSRWYPFAWLATLRDARPSRQSPTVSILEFVSTLGGAARRFNPRPFGFVNLFQSVEAVAPEFEAEGILHETRYFMALPNGATAPLIGLDFGRTTQFVIEGLRINTGVPVRPNAAKTVRSKKPEAIEAVFKMGENADACRTEGKHREQGIRFENGRHNCPFADQTPYSAVALEFSSLNSAGFQMARLSEFNFEGYFTNQ